MMTLSLKSVPNGIALVTPASRTPGSARIFSSDRSVNERIAASSRYRAPGSPTVPVTTCSGTKPGRIARTWRKLAVSSPAPISRTSAKATCATTSPWRSTRPPRPPVPVLTSSRSTETRFTRSAWTTGITPMTTAAASDSPST